MQRELLARGCWGKLGEPNAGRRNVITGFNHSGFAVKDIEAMVAFYRDTLGLSVMREVDSVAPPEGDHTGIPGARRTLVFVGKPDGEHALELVHFIGPAQPGGTLAQTSARGSTHLFQCYGSG